MYDRPVLDVDDALALVDAALAAAPSETTKPIAVAVVDDLGDWVAFVSMDGVSPFAREYVRRKAYTAVMMRRDVAEFSKARTESGRPLVDLGDPKLVGALNGGVVIRDAGGNIIGGLGVGGANPEEDERIARAALAATPAPASAGGAA
jgi:glc operon protein GlcG